VKIALSRTLSAYMLDRFSTRSVIASLLHRTTISWPKSRKYRTSVPVQRAASEPPRIETTSGRTVATGQRSDVFPDRGAHSEVQYIPQNWITLGTWRIWQCWSPPSPNESEDENTKQQRIEGRNFNHGGKGGMQGCRTAGNGLIHVGVVFSGERSIRNETRSD